MRFILQKIDEIFFLNKAKINHNESLSVNSYPQCNKICLTLGEIE